MEKDKYKNEFDKIPENPKTIAQKRRREELERELSILNKNIASLKTKLRDLDALH
jgi:predicted  nucleic acid-binding Zn-ribbon protein